MARARLTRGPGLGPTVQLGPLSCAAVAVRFVLLFPGLRHHPVFLVVPTLSPEALLEALVVYHAVSLHFLEKARMAIPPFSEVLTHLHKVL